MPRKFTGFLAAVLLPCTSLALEGIVTHITDGDTVWIRPASGDERPLKVRVEGIDAPESCQLGGAAATQALTRRVLGRTVRLEGDGRDAWGRSLGTLWLGDEDVGAWMVAQGWAWSYRYRDRAGRYDPLEATARARGRGLFDRPDPMRPELFRRIHGPCRAGDAG